LYVDTGEGAGQPLGVTVSPDKLVRLMEGIETERDRLRTWLRENRLPLTDIRAPGNDPCSRDTVTVFSQNGESAVEKADAYVTQLTNVIIELRNSARDYGLIEDENTDNFRREIE
jgi:hypothetical protein